MRVFGKADSGFGRRMVLVAGAAAVVLPLAAVAADATTPASATVSACSTTSTGALRLIHPGVSGLRGHCASTETPISWNQVGPQGPRGPQGAQGLQGDKGDPGQKGDQGVQGLAGVSGYIYVEGTATSIAAGSFGSANATCPAGKVPVGGGYSSTDTLNVVVDAPIYLAGWGVQVTNSHATAVSVTALVLCVTAN